MSKPFKAKFDSYCPYCSLPIREGDEARYSHNSVLHKDCADMSDEETKELIRKARREEGYLT